MQKKYVFYVIMIILVLVTPVIVAFIMNFWEFPISDEIADWGAFGDYFGGTLNTLISILTLFFTIIIAYQLYIIEDRRNEKNLSFEKQKFFRELRETEYANISNELYKLWSILTDTDRGVALHGIFALYMKYCDFITYKKHLFPFLEGENFLQLRDYLGELHKYFSEKDEYKVENIPHFNTISKRIDLFHKEMQEFLINDFS